MLMGRKLRSFTRRACAALPLIKLVYTSSCRIISTGSLNGSRFDDSHRPPRRNRSEEERGSNVSAAKPIGVMKVAPNIVSEFLRFYTSANV